MPVVLNLDQFVGPTINIDGAPYELITLTRLPPLDAYRVRTLARRVEVLSKKTDPLTDEEMQELGTLPDQMCRFVVDAPDDVHAKLNDRQRVSIITYCLEGPEPAPAAAPAE